MRKCNAAKRPIWLLELGAWQDDTLGRLYCSSREGRLAMSTELFLPLQLWLASLLERRESHPFLVFPSQKNKAHSLTADRSPGFMYWAPQSCLSCCAFAGGWHWFVWHRSLPQTRSFFYLWLADLFILERHSIWFFLSKWDWTMFYCCWREVQE